MDVNRHVRCIVLVLIVGLLAGCTAPATVLAPPPSTPAWHSAVMSTSAPPSPSPFIPSPSPSPVETDTGGLSDEEASTLRSLEQVDDYPLYTMRYEGAYDGRAPGEGGGGEQQGVRPSAWACTLLAALGNANNPLYGRNFDWEFSPALLLWTNPPDGYASVSMVDMAYLGFAGEQAAGLVGRPLDELTGLLDAPQLPFDGMNEHGLVIGMAAVPSGQMVPDPAREMIGSLGVIRQMLDHARDVDEALAVMQRYNVDMEGGPPLHYLIADAAGRAVLVEFYQGQMQTIWTDEPWHAATNFLLSAVDGPAEGNCWRYDTINRRLAEAEGRLSTAQAMELLSDVSQGITQWSIVYGMRSGVVEVALGRAYDRPHAFWLDGQFDPGE